jgi:acetoin utilization deacetylase AcuC-like enzyme
MIRLGRLARRAGLGRRSGLRVWYDPAFRLPIPSLGARHGLEPRRADFVAWFLTIEGWLAEADLVRPAPVRYADLARVHTEELLASLADGSTLARVFHADPAELSVDEVMLAVRLAAGGTLEAARHALAVRGPALCLLGGFHHAFPDKAGGLCPVNDMAVAIAALRAEGFVGAVVVIDLDAHPPDGTAACLAGDERSWVGSLSGSDWGPLARCDETVLPTGADDATYLAALDALLRRMPRADLAFVIAGGDVLAGDRLGLLGLTEAGVRERDRRVARALAGVASVWVPGGGYTPRAWRALAGTALVLLGRGRASIPEIDPMDLQFSRVARRLDPSLLGADDAIDLSDLEVELGMRAPGPARLLDHYTGEGVLHALHAYGVLEQLERLGYQRFRVEIEAASSGQRVRVRGRDPAGAEHLLAEAVLERRRVADRPVVFVHWLTLRHPIASFGEARARLPGQEVPGLGLSLEVIELLGRAAARTGAQGVAFQPSYLHTAWSPTSAARFVDPVRQGRYEALIRDLGHIGRFELSRRLQRGEVRLDGAPYVWEPEPMVFWLSGGPDDGALAAAERDRVRFTLVDEP